MKFNKKYILPVFIFFVFFSSLKIYASKKYVVVGTAHFEVVVKKGREHLAYQILNYGEFVYANLSDQLICDLEKPIYIVLRKKENFLMKIDKKQIIFADDLETIRKIQKKIKNELALLFSEKLKNENRFTLKNKDIIDIFISNYFNEENKFNLNNGNYGVLSSFIDYSSGFSFEKIDFFAFKNLDLFVSGLGLGVTDLIEKHQFLFNYELKEKEFNSSNFDLKYRYNEERYSFFTEYSYKKFFFEKKFENELENISFFNNSKQSASLNFLYFLGLFDFKFSVGYLKDSVLDLDEKDLRDEQIFRYSASIFSYEKNSTFNIEIVNFSSNDSFFDGIALDLGYDLSYETSFGKLTYGFNALYSTNSKQVVSLPYKESLFSEKGVGFGFNYSYVIYNRTSYEKNKNAVTLFFQSNIAYLNSFYDDDNLEDYNFVTNLSVGTEIVFNSHYILKLDYENVFYRKLHKGQNYNFAFQAKF